MCTLCAVGVFESIYGDEDEAAQAGKKLNFMANEIIVNALDYTKEVTCMISQEIDKPIVVCGKCTWFVCVV